MTSDHRGDRARRLRSIASTFLLMTMTMPSVLTASQPISGEDASLEYRVKAAFLYKLAKFVTWPEVNGASEGNRFTLCVLGVDPFGPILNWTVNGKNVEGKQIDVRRVKTVAEATTCHVVFISLSERSRVREVLDALAAGPVLTVSEIPGFAERGGMINFVLEDDRVQFQINPQRAGLVGLGISSHLLRLARVVSGEPGGRQ